ncbi:MAG: ribosomal protein S18-alanine N-acetyltransferase [Mogibacterium sp.]|nr:ribosomal protein S18-alanine N-acetyltransferase [Mogibacterium sp.]
MQNIEIRQAKLYDVPALARIERDSFDSPWSADEIAKDVTSDDGSIYVAVALIGDERAGYADMRIIKGESQIYNIAVAPEFRKQGIGEALLDHMVRKSEELGLRIITLEVRAGNEAAMVLYEKMGFRKVGTRPGYYAKGSEDAVLMDKVLGEITIDMNVQ